MTIDQVEQSAKQHQGIIDWVSKNMGARVTGIRRQRRWRPVWRVDAEKDGVPLPLHAPFRRDISQVRAVMSKYSDGLTRRFSSRATRRPESYTRSSVTR